MTNIKKILAISFLALSISFNNVAYSKNTVSTTINETNNICPDLSFEELLDLSMYPHPEETLAFKLQKILTTPIVNNSYNPTPSKEEKFDPALGNYIRVASWNIARGMNLDNLKLVFSNPDELLKKVNAKADKKAVIKEINKLKNADIIVLNEVDNGMPRTKYKNVAQELAESLHYNYAFGTEFVEVDPAHLGKESCEWSEERFLFPDKKYEVDKSKYKGIHGNAILSKYPLENVRIIRLPNAYDWYEGERNKVTELEAFKRNAAAKVFKEEMLREIRQGGRMALIADIVIPRTNQKITVVAAHIENRAMPDRRVVQLKTILDDIKSIDNPVIFAGDFNTTINDGTPTSVSREIVKRIKDPDFLARQALLSLVSFNLAANLSTWSGNFARKYKDPTVKNIPILAPNKERAFFDTLKNFKFSDDKQFDFRGLKHKTRNGNDGLMAQSNERDIKGFIPTYLFERPILIGRYKLDWIFIKSFSTNSIDNKQSFKLAPHFGSTLRALDYSFSPILSDHVPVTVDLPLEEPPVGYKKPKSSKKTVN